MAFEFFSSLSGTVSSFNLPVFIALLVIYLGIIFGLAWYGYRKTKDASDYMLAGRKTHPLVMAISYGATFISTSAIIGFGGTAAAYGMSLLWLAFLNILVGVIIAFLVFGPKMRRMGKKLRASTFPEFIGRRFKSRGLQTGIGLFIAVLMPLYASSVLIGAARFIETTFGITYSTALIIFTIVVAIYVIVGGLMSVMYTDAFQGMIMFFGMAFLLIFTYVKLGGIVEAHTALTNLAPLVPDSLAAIGHQGWTYMPVLGSELWWTVVSSLVLGVGIGIIAQPQLAVRFMTVKDNKTLKRAVFAGGPFIFMMAGVAYIVGSLCNVWFFNETGQIALDAVGGNIDSIIPAYINGAMPEIFIMIFMLSLLSAAMSTAGAQFHTMGTSVGYDVIRNGIFKGKSSKTILFSRIGMVITIIAAVILAFILPGGIIARATAVFMGICTAALLPMYAGGLFWKKMTKQGAFASFGIGLFASVFWYLFVHAKEAVPFGVCEALFGVPTLLTGTWTLVDPILIATPLSIIAAIFVSLMTQPPEEKFVEDIFSENEDEIEVADAA
ncbi:Osmoregulated proline transporter OpuE [Methanimicrococcus stummii]|uniref:Osmoregulated proline transporter OpuE n=1 Tax=Methanimicrococcus stummii TaxID=3028294 RepID=A0AA96V9Q9_9EURY|nr:sodium:solute symporter family protein [Methanimicrococcus sp. Es2]WNY28245.1 Osmoregulated proline transporter OpuE [Methanimicrococcus sp. Es2]